MIRLALVLALIATPALAAPSQAGKSQAAMSAARAAGDSPTPCAKQIGKAKALEVARYCRFVSGATRPPCNTTNACSLMVEHIEWACRSTAKEPLPCGSELTAADWKRIPKVKVK
jgi:hypothetical protein